VILSGVEAPRISWTQNRRVEEFGARSLAPRPFARCLHRACSGGWNPAALSFSQLWGFPHL